MYKCIYTYVYVYIPIQPQVARLKQGDAVGEMLLVHQAMASTTIRVASRVSILAEIPLSTMTQVLERRPEILENLEEMVHGGRGQEDMFRARTPLGGRAATPGGAVARGIVESQGVITFPFPTQKQARHIDKYVLTVFMYVYVTFAFGIQKQACRIDRCVSYVETYCMYAFLYACQRAFIQK